MSATHPILRRPAVTYALITENTGKGIIMTCWCLTRPQYKAIRRAQKVVIRNIGKSNFMELIKKA